MISASHGGQRVYRSGYAGRSPRADRRARGRGRVQRRALGRWHASRASESLFRSDLGPAAAGPSSSTPAAAAGTGRGRAWGSSGRCRSTTGPSTTWGSRCAAAPTRSTHRHRLPTRTHARRRLPVATPLCNFPCAFHNLGLKVRAHTPAQRAGLPRQASKDQHSNIARARWVFHSLCFKARPDIRAY
jgi:hypothetical protein